MGGTLTVLFLTFTEIFSSSARADFPKEFTASFEAVSKEWTSFDCTGEEAPKLLPEIIHACSLAKTNGQNLGWYPSNVLNGVRVACRISADGSMRLGTGTNGTWKFASYNLSSSGVIDSIDLPDSIADISKTACDRIAKLIKGGERDLCKLRPPSEPVAHGDKPSGILDGMRDFQIVQGCINYYPNPIFYPHSQNGCIFTGERKDGDAIKQKAH